MDGWTGQMGGCVDERGRLDGCSGVQTDTWVDDRWMRRWKEGRRKWVVDGEVERWIWD